MNDVRKMIYGTIIGFFLVIGVWFSIVYVAACGFTFTCNRADPLVIRTPIPTLIPAVHSESQMGSGMTDFKKCEVAAVDLIGAWVSAGYSKTEKFPFEDIQGNPCEGTYADDIQHLFVENNLWQPGSIGCVSCHNADLTDRSAGLDLTSYEAVLLGSRRVAGSTSAGTDILGGNRPSICISFCKDDNFSWLCPLIYVIIVLLVVSAQNQVSQIVYKFFSGWKGFYS
jgi:hypothetical protein